MLAAMALFTGNDTLLKIASVDLPPGQIMAVRGLFGSAIALMLVIGSGHARHLRELLAPVVAGRGTIEALIALAFITALGDLPLANVTAILQATPLVITLLAVLLGLERVSGGQWLAIATGFLGVLLICKPTPAGLDLPAALAFLAAILAATRDLMTRVVAAHVPTVVVTLSATTMVTILGFVMAFGESWQPLELREVLLLGTAAIFVTLGNLAIIIAFRSGDIAIVSPFRYAVVLLALLVGLIVFGDFPDTIAILGTVLIVVSGLYTVQRGQARLRPSAPSPAVEATAGDHR
jgi:drug/metabolite transporter (DMT)-like permease